jgi:hypothetical protein
MNSTSQGSFWEPYPTVRPTNEVNFGQMSTSPPPPLREKEVGALLGGIAQDSTIGGPIWPAQYGCRRMTINTVYKLTLLCSPASWTVGLYGLTLLGSV